MKSVFFLSILSIICFSVSAQDNTGKELIGTNIYYYHTSTISERLNKSDPLKSSTSAFQLFPYFGVFVNDKLMLGAGIGYYLQKEASQDRPDETSLTRSKLHTVNLLIRHYHLFSDQFSIFAQGLIGGGLGKVQEGLDNYSGYESNLKGLQAFISLGLNYKINNHLGIEVNYGSLGVTTLFHNYGQPGTILVGKDVITSVGFDFDKSTFRLGVNYTF